MTDEDLQRLKAISCFKQYSTDGKVCRLSFEHVSGGRVVLIVKDFETELREDGGKKEREQK